MQIRIIKVVFNHIDEHIALGQICIIITVIK